MSKKIRSSSHVSILMNDIHTEIIMFSYSNNIHIIITQVGKPGTIISASSEEKLVKELDEEKIFETKTIFGKKDNEIYDLLARRLIQSISTNSKKKLILNVALNKEFEQIYEDEGPKECLLPIIDLIEKNKVWE
jgi:protein involved in ribonucleotide reduction